MRHGKQVGDRPNGKNTPHATSGTLATNHQTLPGVKETGSKGFAETLLCKGTGDILEKQ